MFMLKARHTLSVYMSPSRVRLFLLILVLV